VCDAGSTAPAGVPPITSPDQMFEESGNDLRTLRGPAPRCVGIAHTR
jgi:hypothetical protein